MLSYQVLDSIQCTICQLPVYNYREIRGNDITCSYECESILYLSKQNRMIHEKDQVKTFESEMIRSTTYYNLDEYDNMSVDSKWNKKILRFLKRLKNSNISLIL